MADALTKMVNAHSYLLTKVYLNSDGEMVQSPGEDKFIAKIIKTTNSEFEALKENLVRPFKLEKRAFIPCGNLSYRR